MVSPSFFYVPPKVMLFCLLLNETFALRLGLWQLERQLWVPHLALEDGCNWNCWFPMLQNVNQEFCKIVGDCRQWPKVYNLCHTQTVLFLHVPVFFDLCNVQKLPLPRWLHIDFQTIGITSTPWLNEKKISNNSWFDFWISISLDTTTKKINLFLNFDLYVSQYMIQNLFRAAQEGIF